jgi:hypothetical protein
MPRERKWGIVKGCLRLQLSNRVSRPRGTYLAAAYWTVFSPSECLLVFLTKDLRLFRFLQLVFPPLGAGS